MRDALTNEIICMTLEGGRMIQYSGSCTQTGGLSAS